METRTLALPLHSLRFQANRSISIQCIAASCFCILFFQYIARVLILLVELISIITIHSALHSPAANSFLMPF